MFKDCSHINASGSHMSEVGRDQHNVGGDQHFHQTVVIPAAASHEVVQHVLDNHYRVSQQQSYSSSTVDFTSHHHRSPCDLASNLIVDITNLLQSLAAFSVDYRYLQKLVLKPLHQTLFLTGIALQVYQDTPLGPSLVSSINSTVQQCCTILQSMLHSTHRYRNILCSTPIRDLWPRVLWSGYEVHVLTWKLTAHQRALGQFLGALNS